MTYDTSPFTQSLSTCCFQELLHSKETLMKKFFLSTFSFFCVQKTYLFSLVLMQNAVFSMQKDSPFYSFVEKCEILSFRWLMRNIGPTLQYSLPFCFCLLGLALLEACCLFFSCLTLILLCAENLGVSIFHLLFVENYFQRERRRSESKCNSLGIRVQKSIVIQYERNQKFLFFGNSFCYSFGGLSPPTPSSSVSFRFFFQPSQT